MRYPRLVPKDAACAERLAKRTLTNLYNERPAWLHLAHARLDEAVFAAYAWPPDLSDEALLGNLLSLNLERSAPGLAALHLGLQPAGAPACPASGHMEG